MLWETLTGREHLQFYGRLKSLSSSSLDIVSCHMLTSIPMAWNIIPWHSSLIFSCEAITLFACLKIVMFYNSISGVCKKQ
jgi:hypothetical protein